jgi:predicted RNA binding protein YcfA (HicA-like mRNA interferase family)
MAPKFPVCKPKQVIKILEGKGFNKVSQKGSHIKYSNGKRVVIIPNHSELAIGTLRSILEQAGISAEEFLNELK